MKLLFAFGTRPEIIKLAPVIAEARRYPKEIEIVTCATGQHREMLDQALSAFGLKPDLDLGVMLPGQSLASLTSRLIDRTADILASQKPDVVLVQGDATSAFTSALAAFYAQIPVGHVEAGLRTGYLDQPFPEELNRSMIARMARWNFAPTRLAAGNLEKEGVAPENIFLTGNTVIDALDVIRSRWSSGANLTKEAASPWTNKDLVLVTTHRRENFGAPLHSICRALRTLAQRHPELAWVFPVHLNPEVQNIVRTELKGIANLHLIKPLDYEATLHLQNRARLLITDSGGLQEEATAFGVPTVVLRAHTERSEGVQAGFAVLAGVDENAIVSAAENFLSRTDIRQELADKPNPYGDGHASERIMGILLGKSVGTFRG